MLRIIIRLILPIISAFILAFIHGSYGLEAAILAFLVSVLALIWSDI